MCVIPVNSSLEIKLVLIRLPNGASNSTCYSGTINFTFNFYLINVFYILDFHTNIISLPLLTTSLNCHVYFTYSDCLTHGTQPSRWLVQLSCKTTSTYLLFLEPLLFLLLGIVSYLPYPLVVFKLLIIVICGITVQDTLLMIFFTSLINIFLLNSMINSNLFVMPAFMPNKNVCLFTIILNLLNNVLLLFTWTFGFSHKNQNLVCKLNKYLYGLQ